MGASVTNFLKINGVSIKSGKQYWSSLEVTQNPDSERLEPTCFLDPSHTLYMPCVASLPRCSCVIWKAEKYHWDSSHCAACGCGIDVIYLSCCAAAWNTAEVPVIYYGQSESCYSLSIRDVASLMTSLQLLWCHPLSAVVELNRSEILLQLAFMKLSWTVLVNHHSAFLSKPLLPYWKAF